MGFWGNRRLLAAFFCVPWMAMAGDQTPSPSECAAITIDLLETYFIEFREFKRYPVHDRNRVRLSGEIYVDSGWIMFFTRWSEPFRLGTLLAPYKLGLKPQVQLDGKNIILTHVEVQSNR